MLTRNCTSWALKALAGQYKALTELYAAVTELAPPQRALAKGFIQTLKEGHGAACGRDRRSSGR